MGYKLNDGTVIQKGTPFSTGGINYPGNWIQNSSLTERNDIGITEYDDTPVWYDKQFYYSKDNPVDIAYLKEVWVEKQKATANQLLAKCDWLVIRAAEGGTACPDAWKTYRTNVRTVSGTREGEVKGCADTPALAALVNENKLTAWPTEPT